MEETKELRNLSTTWWLKDFPPREKLPPSWFSNTSAITLTSVTIHIELLHLFGFNAIQHRKTLTLIWSPLWWFETWTFLRFWGDSSWALFINHLPSSSIHLFLLVVVGFFSCPGSDIRNIPKKNQFQFISTIGWEHQRYLQGRGNWITSRFWNWTLQRECDENHCRFPGPQFLRIMRPPDLVESFAFENTKIKSKTEGVWTRSIARS